jgi:hypothetical protein
MRRFRLVRERVDLSAATRGLLAVADRLVGQEALADQLADTPEQLMLCAPVALTERRVEHQRAQARQCLPVSVAFIQPWR